MEHQDSTADLDSGLRGHAQAFVEHAKENANARVLQLYQSPLALVRLVSVRMFVWEWKGTQQVCGWSV